MRLWGPAPAVSIRPQGQSDSNRLPSQVFHSSGTPFVDLKHKTPPCKSMRQTHGSSTCYVNTLAHAVYRTVQEVVSKNLWNLFGWMRDDKEQFMRFGGDKKWVVRLQYRSGFIKECSLCHFVNSCWSLFAVTDLIHSIALCLKVKVIGAAIQTTSCKVVIHEDEAVVAKRNGWRRSQHKWNFERIVLFRHAA